MEDLKKKALSAPLSPGVYVFKDSTDRPIYIGKASKLKERLRNYFSSKDPKVVRMLAEAVSLEFFETRTEKDAFFLENELIRKYQPKYNIRLRDDKSYPYLEIRMGNEFPGIYIARRARRKGSLYFGPFVPALWARRIKDLISILFGIRQCREKLDGKRDRPCLDYYIGRCAAPCVGFISRDDYMQRVKRAIDFLKGGVERERQRLKQEMWDAAKNMNFERASYLRDLLFTVEEFSRRPTFDLNETTDIFGFYQQGTKWALRVERIRGKRREPKSFSGESLEPDPVIAIVQFYERVKNIPQRIVTAFTLIGGERLKEYIKEKFGRDVALESPVGDENFIAERIQREAERLVVGIRPEEELSEVFALPSVPYRIEGMDISHFSGKEVVGSVVVFEGGKPVKEEYRHYKLDEKNDDFANLAEMVKRRYQKHTPPDLLLIDGGRGQLSAVLEALSELGIKVNAISFAKGEERIFTPERDFVLPGDSQALKLLQRIRDEAHRFAIGFHRKVRQRREFKTVLEEVKGIGKKRMLELLRKYRSLDEIRNASEEELAAIVGKSEAKALKEKLNENRD
ncbi:MAG: excinuclease ABC subunit UvrC [Candidatus Aminicenantes bacterium]|nr:excinuclease ABC subunit UvrC [Candidatus Aminicenantes bacterium]